MNTPWIHSSAAPTLTFAPATAQRVSWKPAGLWASYGDAWERKCRRDHFNEETLQHRYDLTAWVERCHLVVITTLEERDAFEATYGVIRGNYRLIDWDAVAREYDGIVMMPVAFNDNAWYGGWDIPSACIWHLPEESTDDVLPDHDPDDHVRDLRHLPACRPGAPARVSQQQPATWVERRHPLPPDHVRVLPARERARHPSHCGIDEVRTKRGQPRPPVSAGADESSTAQYAPDHGDTTMTITTTATELFVAAATQAPTSIRQIIRQGLLAGEDTKTIAAKVKALHPDSAAAAKSVKHIAFYRAEMRKAGELAPYVR